MPPEICPTCQVKNAYIEVSTREASLVSNPHQTTSDPDKFLQAIEKFTEKSEFKINPDTKRVKMLIEGIFNNEKNHGLKYCPCRLITKDIEEDLKLVCPCNFLIHETYKENGECWCGLYVKRGKNE